MFQTCTYLYSTNFTAQVKEPGNQSQMFNRKSISSNTTHRQSYHLIQIEHILEHFTQHYFNLLHWSGYVEMYGYVPLKR